MKKLKVNNEFIEILKKINSEAKTIEQWRKVESSDMYQTANFCGGFDATEDEFTFSYYGNDSIEYWFQFSIEIIGELINGLIQELELSEADI